MTPPDLDPVQLESLAKVAERLEAHNQLPVPMTYAFDQSYFSAHMSPALFIALLARCKAVEVEVERYRDEIENHTSDLALAICIANYYDLAREVGADPKMAPFDGILEKFRQLIAERDAATALVIDAVLVEVRKKEPLEDWAVKRPRTAAEIEAAIEKLRRSE